LILFLSKELKVMVLESGLVSTLVLLSSKQ
jgi:hypothetical protein